MFYFLTGLKMEELKIVFSPLKVNATNVFIYCNKYNLIKPFFGVYYLGSF